MLSRKANILRTVSGDTTAATIMATLAMVTKASTAYVAHAHVSAAVSTNLLLVDECGPLLVTDEGAGEGRAAAAAVAAAAFLSLLLSLVLSELRSAPAGLTAGFLGAEPLDTVDLDGDAWPLAFLSSGSTRWPVRFTCSLSARMDGDGRAVNIGCKSDSEVGLAPFLSSPTSFVAVLPFFVFFFAAFLLSRGLTSFLSTG